MPVVSWQVWGLKFFLLGLQYRDDCGGAGGSMTFIVVCYNIGLTHKNSASIQLLQKGIISLIT